MLICPLRERHTLSLRSYQSFPLTFAKRRRDVSSRLRARPDSSSLAASPPRLASLLDAHTAPVS